MILRKITFLMLALVAAVTDACYPGPVITYTTPTRHKGSFEVVETLPGGGMHSFPQWAYSFRVCVKVQNDRHVQWLVKELGISSVLELNLMQDEQGINYLLASDWQKIAAQLKPHQPCKTLEGSHSFKSDHVEYELMSEPMVALQIPGEKITRWAHLIDNATAMPPCVSFDQWIADVENIENLVFHVEQVLKVASLGDFHKSGKIIWQAKSYAGEIHAPLRCYVSHHAGTCGETFVLREDYERALEAIQKQNEDLAAQETRVQRVMRFFANLIK